jgi:cell division septal protein FtsQ
MRKDNLRFPAKIALIIILSLLVVLLCVSLFFNYLSSSGYFKIKESEFFSGQNIFQLNLQREAQRLNRMYPDYKRVMLRRLLPNKIIAEFIPRRPVAILRLSDDFFLDGDGVLFRAISQEYSNLQLPLIIGLTPRISHPRSGIRYNEESLLATLEFINSLNKDSKLTEQLKIEQINLANVNDVFLFTTDGSRINLGGFGSLNKDLLILQRLVNEINLDLTNVEYIDLRFREPAVKYK